MPFTKSLINTTHLRRCTNEIAVVEVVVVQLLM